jgi:hypothetical protein
VGNTREAPSFRFGWSISHVKCSARICPQILAAKQEQASFARRKRTVSSVHCCRRKAFLKGGLDSSLLPFFKKDAATTPKRINQRFPNFETPHSPWSAKTHFARSSCAEPPITPPVHRAFSK